MKQLIQILTVHSVRELFKYKSFFFLVFLLILLDHALKKYVKPKNGMPDFKELKSFGNEAARFLFEDFPSELTSLLLKPEVILILVLLFLTKQIISLWPSSDMRRMHRNERGVFGIFASLKAVKPDQIIWDALAVGSTCLLVVLFMAAAYAVLKIGWMRSPSVIWPGLFLFAGMLVFPLAMAGFSYSSKLAVLSKGDMKEKLGLFFKLFTNGRVFLWSWLFYFGRVIVEGLFVAIIPVFLMLSMEQLWLRIILSGLSAAPVYAYLKMASFKFFLVVYEPYPLVREEYDAYFTAMKLDK